MDMYTDDLISREELNEKIGGMRKEEILLMPKGEKIYRMLKKLKLMN